MELFSRINAVNDETKIKKGEVYTVTEKGEEVTLFEFIERFKEDNYEICDYKMCFINPDLIIPEAREEFREFDIDAVFNSKRNILNENNYDDLRRICNFMINFDYAEFYNEHGSIPLVSDVLYDDGLYVMKLDDKCYFIPYEGVEGNSHVAISILTPLGPIFANTELDKLTEDNSIADLILFDNYSVTVSTMSNRFKDIFGELNISFSQELLDIATTKVLKSLNGISNYEDDDDNLDYLCDFEEDDGAL